ncbi:phosphatase PAP2 family protein [Actinomycetospora sp.]|jgi:undecaprenyl-diphosphatase|uniref:phosphatase PAP2 family protein n=1 Tax=Actinomycetospora sp. TaxID=1872135 RepID=UPI002F3E8155
MSSSTLRPVGGPRPRWSGGATSFLLICVILAVGAFEALWFGVVTDTGLAVVDPAVVAWMVDHRSAGPVIAARVVSDVGAPAVTVTAALVVLGWWAVRRAWPAVVSGGIGLGLLIAVDVWAKSLVARPRPPLGWHAVAVPGYSFPSGHAMLSLGIVLLIGRLVHRQGLLSSGRGPRWAVGATTGALLLAVGTSRLVLGVHYPSDVLAGWLLAVLVVAAVALVETAWTRGALS